MVYIHTAFFICPSVSAKNRPGFLLWKPERFVYFMGAFSGAQFLSTDIMVLGSFSHICI